MDCLPARQDDQDRGDRADQQRDDRDHGIDLHQRLRLVVNLACGDRTGAEDSGGRGHGVPPVPGVGASSTITRPTIVWCPIPQNSLQMIRKSPEALGVMRRP